MTQPQALIKDLEGEITVSRNGETIEVKAGDYLLPGDEVTTGATGRLGLEFAGTDGQIPAAGVMTANGKLTLGEQPGPNGLQQIVVMEDGECFEFTTELAENSAAAEGGAVSGLFGAGLLGAGSGSLGGAGALAAGAFLAGGSGDSSGDSATGSTAGRASVGAGQFSSADSPQSPEEFAAENLTQENLEQSVIEPIQTAFENSENNPESTPDNAATAGEDVAFAGLENVHDGLVATTGEGSPQADVVQMLVDGVNGTPAGETLSPATGPLVDAVNTDLGLDTIAAALPNSDSAQGGMVSGVVDLVDSIAQPLSQEVEPIDMVIETLKEPAAEVDSILDSLLSQISTEVPNMEGGGSEPPSADALIAQLTNELAPDESAQPTPAELTNELPTQITDNIPALNEEELPSEVGGVLGGADTLQTTLANNSGSGEGDNSSTELLGTVTGISSTADAAGVESSLTPPPTPF